MISWELYQPKATVGALLSHGENQYRVVLNETGWLELVDIKTWKVFLNIPEYKFDDAIKTYSMKVINDGSIDQGDSNMNDNDEYDWGSYMASSEEADRLYSLSDKDFLDYIIANGTDCDDVVKGFKAWTIAKKLKNNHWTPTIKQREAIINVFCFSIYGAKPNPYYT